MSKIKKIINDTWSAEDTGSNLGLHLPKFPPEITENDKKGTIKVQKTHSVRIKNMPRLQGNYTEKEGDAKSGARRLLALPTHLPRLYEKQTTR